jgi:hypothetical protein
MTAEQLEDPEGRRLVEQIHARKAAPTDPRERALWAKQQRGAGPKPEGLRKRGRVISYRDNRS